MDRIRRLVDEVNAEGTFDVCYDLNTMLSLPEDADPLHLILPECCDRLKKISSQTESASHDCPAGYIFASAQNDRTCRIDAILRDFDFCGADAFIQSLHMRNAITTVKYAAFQIIRLKRRTE